MYTDIVNNFKDKLVGTAVDNVVDSGVDKLKNKNILANTYVWTCINKETHNGTIANLTFINKLGKRQRVPYDRLAQFCQSNYISNIIVEDGKVKMIGCSLYDIPDFRLNSYGQYELKAPHDENWVYNKALPYIQSQERLIQEDYNNGSLKTARGEGNQLQASANIQAVAGGISDIRGTAEAVAITAVTAAGAAAVTGTVVAGKAIYNQLNKKKLVEEQDKICSMLHKCNNFVKVLTSTKLKTNNMYRSNKNLVTYNNSIESNNENTGTLRNEINKFGINGCIQKTAEVVNSCKARANAAKVIDMPLKNVNTNFGTLNAYIQNIEQSLNNVKQLHLETKNLINENIAYKNKVELEQEQERQRLNRETILVNDINNALTELTRKLNEIKTIQVNANNIGYIENTYNELKIEQELSNIRRLTEGITDVNNRNNFGEQLMNLQFDTSNSLNRIKISKNNIIDSIKNDLSSKLLESEQIINELLNSVDDTNTKQQKINSFDYNINYCKDNLGILNSVDKQLFNDRISQLENKLNKSMSSIDSRIKDIEKQNIEYDKLLLMIDRKRNEINKSTKSDNIKRIIDSFNGSSSTALIGIKNTAVIESMKQAINSASSEFNEIYNNKLNEEQRLLNEKQQKIAETILLLENKINELKGINPDIITEESIELLKIPKESEYTCNIHNADYTELRPVKDKYRDLEQIYFSKKRKFTEILNKSNMATRYLNSEISSIRRDLIRLDKYNKDRVKHKIESLKINEHLKDLQTTEWIDTIIVELSQELEHKCVELCI